MTSSRTSVLGAKADYLGSMGLETQGRQYRKAAAISEQNQSFSQQSLELERFITQMQIGAEAAAEMRGNLASVNELSLKKIQKEFDPLNDVLKGFKTGVQEALSGLLSGQKSVGEAFSGLLDSMLNQLSTMAAQWVTDELFGGLFGKEGNETDSAKEANGIAGLGGEALANPLAMYSFANPLPVAPVGGAASALTGGFGQAAPTNFLGLLGEGSIFGGGGFGSDTLPLDIVSANDDLFSSLTSGIVGVLGGGGGAAGGIGNAIASVFFGGAGGGSAGGGFGTLLSTGFSLVSSLFGFHSGGRIGDKAHVQAFSRGGSVKGCGCRACSMARGGQAGSGLEESIEEAMRRERSMSGGREPVLIVANRDEFIVPANVATRLNEREKAYLLGKSAAPKASVANYSRGGSLSAIAGSSIANNVTNNMNKSASYRGGDITYNEAGGGINESEARRLDAAITAKTMEILQQQKRPRGLLY
jgi:hypothetical protein